jgi:hypothetical protein
MIFSTSLSLPCHVPQYVEDTLILKIASPSTNSILRVILDNFGAATNLH